MLAGKLSILVCTIAPAIDRGENGVAASAFKGNSCSVFLNRVETLSNFQCHDKKA